MRLFSTALQLTFEKLRAEDVRTRARHLKGKLSARERISLLVDPNTFFEYDALVESPGSSVYQFN